MTTPPVATLRASVAERIELAEGSAEKDVKLPKLIDLAVPRPCRLAPAATLRSEFGMLPARLRVPVLTVVGPE